MIRPNSVVSERPGVEGRNSARFAPSNRRRLSAPGMPTFLAIADLWGGQRTAAPADPRLSITIHLSKLVHARAPTSPLHAEGRCPHAHFGGAGHPPGLVCAFRRRAARWRGLASPAARRACVRWASPTRSDHQRHPGRSYCRAAFPRCGLQRPLHAAACR